jgi:DNA-binding response OmpR family regulator
MSIRVLLVDDDVDLLDVTGYAMRREGYTVLSAIDGHQALERFEADHPDIVVLDVNLPKVDGFEVCRRIRIDDPTPIIMLTARDEEADVLRGLRLGADDYVAKPFSAKQLMARMSAVLRRCRTDPYRDAVRELSVGAFRLDFHSHQATSGEVVVQLTPLEFRLTYMLAMNEGRVVPYTRLVEFAWGYEGGDAYLLKTHICHVRKKLGLPTDGPASIKSVPGVGYCLARG